MNRRKIILGLLSAPMALSAMRGRADAPEGFDSVPWNGRSMVESEYALLKEIADRIFLETGQAFDPQIMDTHLRLTLPEELFKYRSTELNNEGVRAVTYICEELRRKQNQIRLEVVGHYASPTTEQALMYRSKIASARRASLVAQTILQRFNTIESPIAVEWAGAGAKFPLVADLASPENSRVEILIYPDIPTGDAK